MTEDELAGLGESFRPLLSWAEAVSQHYAMLRTEPPFTSTQALKESLASAYAALRATPVADTAGIDAAWAAAEAALPEGWLLDGVRLAGIAPAQVKAGWEAAAIGKWSRSSRSRPATYGYSATPAAALLALAAALRTPKPEGER